MKGDGNRLVQATVMFKEDSKLWCMSLVCKHSEVIFEVPKILPKHHDHGTAKVVIYADGEVLGISFRQEIEVGAEWHWFGCTDIGFDEFIERWVQA